MIVTEFEIDHFRGHNALRLLDLGNGLNVALVGNRLDKTAMLSVIPYVLYGTVADEARRWVDSIDSDAGLVVQTDNGVFRWDSETLTHYGLSEGLAGSETNRAGGIVDRQNRVAILLRHAQVRSTDPHAAALSGGQGALSGRHRALPDGGFLRGLLRGRTSAPRSPCPCDER